MEANKVVLFLGKEQDQCKPVFLQSVLFCPLLTWISQEILSCGIHEFFVVCSTEHMEDALSAIPEEADVTLCSPSDYLASLTEFLSSEGNVLLINRPVFPSSIPGSGSYLISRDTALSEAGRLAALVGQELSHGPCFSPIEYGSTLQTITDLCRKAIVARHLQNNVCMLDPDSVYIDPRVIIGAGTTILPGTILRGYTVIGNDCELGPNSMITDCTVGNDTVINASQLKESIVDDRVSIGPFTQIRPGCHIHSGVKIGDFVECKNADIDQDTHVAHLTYLGDIDVGSGVNFGCGTVVCNYDGAQKYHSSIGDHAFIGCNTNLISPVHVGSGAYIAAGSTVTKDVPDNALAFNRSRDEKIFENWASRRRALLNSKF